DVVVKVYENGESIRLALDRLGRPYYSAFQPIRDVNGEIIGMVSVGTPTNLLFEDTRQQLITTFLIATLISLLTAFFGYLAIRYFRQAQVTKGK
ncbi:cache domain-containing protein, partial [Patescibacteria group bacterium]